MREVPVTKIKKRDPFVKLTLVQFIVCAVAAGIIFGVFKLNSSAFEEMKSEFMRLTEKSWDLSTGVHKWRQSVSEPSAEEETEASDSDESAAGAFSDEASETNGGANETEVEESVEGAEVASEITDTRLSAGGADLSEEQAADCLNFSFYESGDIPCMPVSGTVTSVFGERVHPVYGTDGFHSGTDIAAAEGTPIRAALDGTVIETGIGETAGKYVKLSHENGLFTLYCHCSEINTQEGVRVRKGDVIAFVGETGLATGPHVHFEVQRDGEKLDPAFLLENAQVLA